MVAAGVATAPRDGLLHRFCHARAAADAAVLAPTHHVGRSRGGGRSHRADVPPIRTYVCMHVGKRIFLRLSSVVIVYLIESPPNRMRAAGGWSLVADGAGMCEGRGWVCSFPPGDLSERRKRVAASLVETGRREHGEALHGAAMAALQACELLWRGGIFRRAGDALRHLEFVDRHRHGHWHGSLQVSDDGDE